MQEFDDTAPAWVKDLSVDQQAALASGKPLLVGNQIWQRCPCGQVVCIDTRRRVQHQCTLRGS